MHQRPIGETTCPRYAQGYVHFSADMIVQMSEEEAGDFIHDFVNRAQAFENGPTTTYFARLVDAGMTLPEPSALDDEAITRKLWEVIDGLSVLQTFLAATDHLTDRELYARIHERVLHEERPDLDPSISYNATIYMLDREECDPMTLEPRVVKVKRDKRLPRGHV